MANPGENRYLKKLINRLFYSDEIRTVGLIKKLSRLDRDDCSSILLEDVIKQHLFYYQEEPDWRRIVEELLKGYRFRAARVVTLYVPDDALRSQLIVTCLINMRSQGIPIRPNPILH